LRRQVPARPTPAPSPGVRWSRPGYLVRRLNQVHYALFFEECGDARMTPVQYGLLSALMKKPRGMDQNSLATEIGLDRTTTSDVLRRLEARGLVTRERSTTDKRMNIARLSPEGRTTTALLEESMGRAQERLLEPLPAAERERFMANLVHLVESFDRIGLHVFKDL
jgi:DNA-binding MarR family transcriptional regulator